MMFGESFGETCQTMAQDYLYDYIWVGVGVIGGAVDTDWAFGPTVEEVA